MSNSIRDATTRLTVENEPVKFAECGVLARATVRYGGANRLILASIHGIETDM